MPESFTTTIPRMYGDHHVRKVREVLSNLPGVQEINANALMRSVSVQFDPALVNTDKITDALDAAGYEQGVFTAGEEKIESAWYRALLRQTDTKHSAQQQ